MATIADTVIDKLAGSVLALAREHREAAEEMQEIFSEKRPFLFMDKESDLRKRKIIREKEYEKSKKSVQAVGELAVALQKLNDDYAKHATSIGESEEAVKSAISAALDFSDSMDRAQQNMLLSAHNALENNNDLRSSIAPLIDTTQEVGKGFSDVADKQKLAVLHADKFQRSLIDMRNTVYDTVKMMASFKTGIALAAVGFKKSFDDLEYSLKNQVPIYNTLSGSIMETAAAYGVSTRALMEVQNEHTMAILAASNGVGGMSGSTKFALEEFDRLRSTLHNVTGDYDDSLKLYGQLREQLSFSGAAFSAEEFNKAVDGPNGMIKQMQTLALMTGKSVEQIAEMNTAMMKDRDMRFTMLGLDKKQRQGRLQEIMQYQESLIAKGMEADAAFEAATSLQKMNAQISPKERYKQAAKLRGIAGALGVAGGEKAMARAMKPPSQWTEKEREENAAFATQMETKMGGLAGGGISQQMFGGAFQDAMGGDLYNTMVKAQSAAGLEQRAISEETRDEIKKQTNQLEGAQGSLLAVKKAFERVVAWGSDAGVFLAGGIAASLASMVTQLWAIQKYVGAIAAKQGAPLPPGAAGKLARGAGAIAGVGAAGAAGYAIGTGLNKLPELLGFDSISTNIVDGITNIKEKSQDDVYKQAMEDRKLAKDKAIEEMKKSDDPVMKELVATIAAQKKLSEEQFKLLQKQTNLQLEANELAAEGNEVRKAAAVKGTRGVTPRPPGKA